MEKKRILVAVLNWGLGHATRSIPIIRALEDESFQPILASDGPALQLLQKEFPHLEYFTLPSYNISYPKNPRNFRGHFILKGPQLFKSIYSERKAVEKIVARKNIKGIISDNRLGAYSAKVPSVYVTHQLQVISGRTTFLSSLLHRIFINKFHECWVPDRESPNGFSGKMSHGLNLPRPVKFMGIISRFRKLNLPHKYDLLILLSGPEPQRGELEKILLEQLKGFRGNLLFVLGKMETRQVWKKTGKMEVVNFLFGKELEKALNQSRLILSRSGYTTILDLAVLEKKAFFIPTPGQFEQEYLAERMERLGIAPFCRQEAFSPAQLERTETYSGFAGGGRSGSLRDLLAFFKSE